MRATEDNAWRRSGAAISGQMFWDRPLVSGRGDEWPAGSRVGSRVLAQRDDHPAFADRVAPFDDIRDPTPPAAPVETPPEEILDLASSGNGLPGPARGASSGHVGSPVDELDVAEPVREGCF